MTIKHKHIEMTLHSWRLVQKPEEITRLIAVELHKIDSATSILQHPDEPDSRHNNCQKIFRSNNGWINGRTDAQRRKLSELLPAIEKALIADGQIRLLARMHSYSSELVCEMVDRVTHIDDEVNALFGVIISMSDRHYGGGPAGGVLFL